MSSSNGSDESNANRRAGSDSARAGAAPSLAPVAAAANPPGRAAHARPGQDLVRLLHRLEPGVVPALRLIRVAPGLSGTKSAPPQMRRDGQVLGKRERGGGSSRCQLSKTQ